MYGEPQYFRLHGGPHYRHQYTKEELRYLEDKPRRNKEAYVLFNNLNVHHDALAFQRLIRGEEGES